MKQTKFEQAQGIFDTQLATVRKPRGSLRVINAALRTAMIVAFVSDAGYKESSAKAAFTKLRKAAIENGIINAEDIAPPAAPVEKGPKLIDVARQIFDKLTTRLNTTSMTPKKFRATVIHQIMDKTGANVQTAAAMYNTCKTGSEEHGCIDTSRLGRKGHPVDTSGNWLRQNAKGVTVATHGTKKDGLEHVVGEQTVTRAEAA